MTHKRTSYRLVCCALILALATPLSGFDTGHHRDLTTAALIRFGFSRDARDTVVLQNWLVDWYAGHTDRTVGEVNTLSNFPFGHEVFKNHDDFITAGETSYLHFDNLYGEKPRLDEITSVPDYWRALGQATSAELHRRLNKNVKEPNVLGILSLLGITLHAVQDFYSHSDWLGMPNKPNDSKPYDVTTWFDVQNAHQTRLASTGAFPDGNESGILYHSRLNKDGYDVQQWDRAYAAAYWASVQWIEAFRQMVEKERSGYWDSCLRDARVLGRDRQTLEADLQSSYETSETSHKWKGLPADISLEELPALRSRSNEFDKRASIFKNAFSKEWVELGLTQPLGHPSLSKTILALPEPAVPAVALDEDAIVLILNDIVGVNTSYSNSRLYAKVHMIAGTFAAPLADKGQDFVEDPVYDATAHLGTGFQHFGGKVLFFVPRGQKDVDITVSLYNAVGSSHDQDQRLRIGPGPAFNLHLIYHPQTGTCTLADGSQPPCGPLAPPLVSQGSGALEHTGSLRITLEKRPMIFAPF